MHVWQGGYSRGAASNNVDFLVSVVETLRLKLWVAFEIFEPRNDRSEPLYQKNDKHTSGHMVDRELLSSL
jgi:hypothetical protein